jgi:hypothetical protein
VASASKDQFHLASYLKEWWDQQQFRYETKVKHTVFASCLLEWMQADASRQEALKAFDEKVEEADNKEVKAALSQLPCTNTPFIDLLILHMDENGDSFITQKELYGIQNLSLVAAQRLGMAAPTEMMDLLIVLSDHLKDRVPSTVKEKDIKLQQSLNVEGMMLSYDIKTKLSEYVLGTRDWLFEELDRWIMTNNGDSEPNLVHILDRMSQLWGGSIQPQLPQLPKTHNSSRLLLLLAGPGMGKSVFSAVVHLKLKVLQDPKSKTILASH